MVLQTTTNPLQPRRLTAALAGHAVGTEVQVHGELGSTSDHVRELGLAGYPHGLAVFAEAQTAGRGRRENRWSSQPGEDLAFSVLLRPGARIELWPRITTLAALAVCQGIRTVTSLDAAIKWPNDVFVRDRKCAGILAETFTGGTGPFMVLGIGVNVNSDAYSPELRDIATSLRLESHRQVDRNALAIALLKALDRQLQRLVDGYEDAMNDVRQRSWLLGKTVTARVDGLEVCGVATGLNSEGHLILQDEHGGILTLSSAEQVRLSED